VRPRWTEPPPPDPLRWVPLILLSVAILLGSFAIGKALLLSPSDPSLPSGMRASFATPSASVPQALIMPTLIYVQEVPTLTPLPTLTPTPDPWLTAVAASQPTPTPEPLACPSTPTLLPTGSICVWPSPPEPTPTPFPRCETPIPGNVCDPWATPLPWSP